MRKNADTAAKRKHEAIYALCVENYAEAARCFTWSAEAYAKDGCLKDAQIMRAATAICQSRLIAERD